MGNAGFEDGPPREFWNWTFSPTNGSCSRAQHTTGTWIPAHSGSRFLGTGRTTDYPNCLSVWQEVNVAPQVGQTYTAGFWLRNGSNSTPAQSQNVVIALWGIGPNGENASKTVTITDFEWSCHQLWFTPTRSGNNRLKIEVYLNQTWNMDVHADDLYLGYGQVDYCNTSPPPTITSVPVSPTPSPPTIFAGNPSSKLFFDNNGNRINLEVCANNLPGQTVKAQLSRPGKTFNVVSQTASGRCVTFWDMDGAGPVLSNTNYTTRAALNQNPNPNWSGSGCFSSTGGQGLCDTKSFAGGGGTTGYKLPYPGGVSYPISRNRHCYPGKGCSPAYDFGLKPINRSIVAARGGLVVYIKENSSEYGRSSYYRDKGNYVKIKHDDGTIALYYHLRKNGAVVVRGQQVQRGQLLGYTGLSGQMTGPHLHFEVKSGATRRIVKFEDIGSIEPVPGRWYTSGNYVGSFSFLGNFTERQQLSDLLPEGQVQFHLNQDSGSNDVKLMAYDYLDDVVDMRIADSEAALQSASWIPYTDTLSWAVSSVFVEYRAGDGRVSTVYSDTIATTANDVITADFQLASDEVCVGEPVGISNNTVPYCPQCSWEWDLDNGYATQSFNPESDVHGAWWEYDYMESYFDPELFYDTPGVYNITASVENESHNSSVSRQVTVIDSISADFTMIRSGNTITVTAIGDDAISWEWGFAEGITATGKTASHTYDNFDAPHIIVLTTQAANGCSGEQYQFVQDYHLYLPTAIKK